MAYQLDRKLKDLEFERKQVLHHLALLDANIATIQKAIALMQTESDITLYSTQNFVYRRRFRLFKGKIRKYLIQILRNKAHKGFTIAELTQRIFEIEQSPDTPTEKHLDSVRKQLNEFYQREWISRTQISRREVYWQWK
ncbi:hypothetical protein [Pasteurella multocida]|uniref:hypothetical protein n=1 Tax=Pasteurella multocida TaxID=747 RepID=UPI000D383772|nr:hypothetical protein [Pasteurella multocida]AWB52927.1 hypothetical protein DB278_05155 [Pasteurella multocida]HDR1023711.1 hypothetical protein [Pasteurella multocida]HDR1152872.1 hypothetical protein [Pasteurella multocida]HDR1158229.1 hypothetical protein [Pasteurella multocida]HDR1170724.1 hypothetical protein [Pasteurella multocida]